MPHPATLILLWACLAIAMQSLQTAGLMLAGVPLLAIVCLLPAAHLLTLLRRTRWIMVSLLFIYAYTTPGEAVWAPLAQFSPTWEGLGDGLLQLCRLTFALAGLSIVLGCLSQQQLVGALYTLAYPLGYFGLSRERIAVRLALTLHYAESAMLYAAVGWRGSLEQMLEWSPHRGGVSAGVPPVVAPAAAECNGVELHAAPFTLRDGLLLAAGCVLLALSTL